MRLSPLVLLAILPLAACSHAGSSTTHDPAPAPVADAAHECRPEALEAFTGSREMSGRAMADYFAPLKKWLDEQNKGHPSGW